MYKQKGEQLGDSLPDDIREKLKLPKRTPIPDQRNSVPDSFSEEMTNDTLIGIGKNKAHIATSRGQRYHRTKTRQQYNETPGTIMTLTAKSIWRLNIIQNADTTPKHTVMERVIQTIQDNPDENYTNHGLATLFKRTIKEFKGLQGPPGKVVKYTRTITLNMFKALGPSTDIGVDEIDEPFMFQHFELPTSAKSKTKLAYWNFDKSFYQTSHIILARIVDTFVSEERNRKKAKKTKESQIKTTISHSDSDDDAKSINIVEETHSETAIPHSDDDAKPISSVEETQSEMAITHSDNDAKPISSVEETQSEMAITHSDNDAKPISGVEETQSEMAITHTDKTETLIASLITQISTLLNQDNLNPSVRITPFTLTDIIKDLKETGGNITLCKNGDVSISVERP